MTVATECKLPHLPRTANDGDEVCDKYGNRWRFNSEDDGWISRGIVIPPPAVTESSDGIITPTIFSQIGKIRQYLNSTGTNLQPLKLVPGVDAYWYYFRSSDKFVKFRPEAEDALRIEVDKGRLFQVIMKEVCPGPRGTTGLKGKQGRSGLPGPAEVCYQPNFDTTDHNRLDFAVYTPTPLLGDRTDIVLPNNHIPDISVRLFKVTLPTTVQTVTGKLTAKKLQQRPKNAAAIYDPLQHLAIYYHSYDDIMPKFQKTRDLLVRHSLGASTDDPLNGIPLSQVLVLPVGSLVAEQPIVTVLVDPLGKEPVRITSTDVNIVIDTEKSLPTITYDPATNIVSGSLFLQNNGSWEGSWCLKSRQKGPDGATGNAGESAVRIIECQLDTTNIVATCPIINARLDCDQSTIFTMCSDILAEICVQKVRLSRSTLPVSDKSALDAVFASAQMVLSDCKRIYRYQVVLADDESDDLSLPHWDPQPGCVTKRHYNRHKFDWMTKTKDLAACANPLTAWYDSDMVPRPGAYPNTIVIAPVPPKDECCQDDFFYCPNIQDGGCVDTGTGEAPPPPPPAPAPPPPGPTPPPPPTGGTLTTDFTWSPLQPLAGQVVNFTQTTSGGQSPYTYNWDFGDGSDPSTLANPSHTYGSAGTYTVVLIVTDSQNNTATRSHTVKVNSSGSSQTACCPEREISNTLLFEISGPKYNDSTTLAFDGAPNQSWSGGFPGGVFLNGCIDALGITMFCEVDAHWRLTIAHSNGGVPPNCEDIFANGITSDTEQCDPLLRVTFTLNGHTIVISEVGGGFALKQTLNAPKGGKSRRWRT